MSRSVLHHKVFLGSRGLGRPIHTVLVYGVMEILFPEAGFGLSNIMADFMRGDFLPFIVIADESGPGTNESQTERIHISGFDGHMQHRSDSC